MFAFRFLHSVLFPQIVAIVDPDPHSAGLNMALDEALLQRVEVPTLRVYGWREPAVSFGYFGRCAEVQSMAAGREMVRRWTGGGIVEHGEDLTYTLLVPRSAAFFSHSALESYRLIHGSIAQWLTACGLDAEVSEVVAEGAAPGGACFVQPVQYDIVARGVKIAGAAQRRTRWGLLHQGSIQAPVEIRRQAGTLGAALGEDVVTARMTPEIQDAAEKIARVRYLTDAWLRKF
jgi:lipoate-protein ligase A